MKRFIVMVVFLKSLIFWGKDEIVLTSQLEKKENPSSKLQVSEKSSTAVLIPIAAYVNEAVIMRSEVLQVAQERQISYADALNVLVEQQLLLQDFNRKKGKISNAQIDIQMEAILQNNFQGNRQAMRQVLQTQGQSFYGLKEDLRQSIIVHVMRQRNVVSQFAISPKQVESYYQSHKKNFQVDAHYLIQQSGFSENSTLTVEGKRMRKIDLLQQLVQSKTDLDSIKKQLNEFSSDPIWYSSSELQPILSSALIALLPGQSTPYLKLSKVYVTSKLLQVEPEKIKSLTEVQAMIEEKLLIEVNNALYNQYIKYLRQHANIRIVENCENSNAVNQKL